MNYTRHHGGGHISATPPPWSLIPDLIVRSTRSALSAFMALNMRSNLKMAATSKEETLCMISGSRKSTIVNRTINKSKHKKRNSKVNNEKTCQPLIKENLDTHEKLSGDSTKNSKILLFSRLRFSPFLSDCNCFPALRVNLQRLQGYSAWDRGSVNVNIKCIKLLAEA